MIVAMHVGLFRPHNLHVHVYSQFLVSTFPYSKQAVIIHDYYKEGAPQVD